MVTVVKNEPETLIESPLSEDSDTVRVVNPGHTILNALITTAVQLETVPTIQLIGTESTLSSVFEDFLIASDAADLVADDKLHLRTGTDISRNQLIITDESVTAVLETERTVAGLSTDDTELVSETAAHFSSMWDSAEPYTLRTPAKSRIYRTLEEALGEPMRNDFKAVINSLDSARGTGDELDEVTVSLLVAAKNEVLLYDISKWGEDVGIASKATFSRAKTDLEELGLIDTEKVPIDVGRPRLRLQLGDESLAAASTEDLASVANGFVS